MNTPHNPCRIPEFGANQGRHTEARIALGTLAATLVALVTAYQLASMATALVVLVILAGAGMLLTVSPRTRGR